MDKICENIYRFSKKRNNAYLVKSDEYILIDGLEEEYSDQYLESVNETVDISDISYIVINHCEMNRVGTLNALLKANRDIKVVATTPALKMLNRYLDCDYKSIFVKDGMELCGLKFRLTPYLNWPDAMMTVFGDTVFSCDLFSSDVSGPSDYYDTYLSQRPESVIYALKTLEGHGISRILPGSGMMIDSNVGDFIKRYKTFTENVCDTVLILYHSVYGNTEKMAKIIGQVLLKNNVPYEMHDMRAGRYKELADKINKCKALILGTDTINADAPCDVWNIISLTNKVINKQKPCMLFGTYAWSVEGLYYMEKHLKMLRYDIYDKPFGVVIKINAEEEKSLLEYTEKFINGL